MFNKCVLLFLLLLVLSGCEKGECVKFTGESLQNSSTFVPTSGSTKVDTGLNAAKGKLLRIRVATGGLYEEPNKYRAIVKFDPRFPQPIVFLATYDNSQRKYIADWAQTTGTFQQRIKALIDYSKMPRISIKNGDAVNLRIIDPAEFYDSNINQSTDLKGDSLGQNTIDVSSVITSTGEVDNMVINTTDVASLCKYNPDICTSEGNKSAFRTYALVGVSPFIGVKEIQDCSIPSIPSSACKYHSGLGMEIRINNDLIKTTDNNFIPIRSGNSKVNKVYYFLSDKDGQLKFTTPLDMSNIFVSDKVAYSDQFLDAQLGKESTGEYESGLINSSKQYTVSKFITGRYLLEVEVGSSTAEIFQQKIRNIAKRYFIISGDTIVHMGEITGDIVEINAPADGRVYVSVENPYNEIGGNVVFSTQTYTASNKISDFLQNNLAKPLKEQLLYLSAIMFGSFTANGNFVQFIQGCLTLYILLYGFNFAIGAVEITVNDLVTRVIKIIIVSALLRPTSWSFFNQYLFSNFLDTTDKLILAVTNNTSSVENIFGFIDPLLNKYTSPNLWFILGNYIGFFGYGYALPAALIIAGILYFLRAILEIFVGYIMAFVSLCVMIAMGPLFIIAMLFERTRSYFDNWLGVMVGYVLQPTLVMIFMLFIDQISSELLNKGLRQVCWQVLWSIDFNWHLGFDLSIHLFDIEGYGPEGLHTIPVVQVLRVSALFFVVMKLAKEVVNLSRDMSDRLTAGSGGEGAVSGGGQSDMTKALMDYPDAIAKKVGKELMQGAPYLLKTPGAIGKRVVKFINNRMKTSKSSDRQGDIISTDTQSITSDLGKMDGGLEAVAASNPEKKVASKWKSLFESKSKVLSSEKPLLEATNTEENFEIENPITRASSRSESKVKIDKKEARATKPIEKTTNSLKGKMSIPSTKR